MTVYIDIVFLENVLLNYIILMATAIISKSKINSWKMLVSSAVGGIYAILNYIIEISFLLNTTIKFVMSIIILLIAFNSNKVKVLIKQLMFFYLVSFTFGGAAFTLLFFVNPKNIILKDNYFIGTYPLKITIFGGFLGFFIILIVSRYMKDRMNKRSMICELEIFYNGKVKKMKTMIDTGNLLREPITQKDVIIVEKNSLRDIVDEDFLKNIDNIINGKWLNSNEDRICSYKFKLIPFMSLGNENGLLIGFKPDYIKIYDEEENIRNDIFIGIYNGRLSKNNLYTSLIGLNVLKKEERKNEFVKNA